MLLACDEVSAGVTEGTSGNCSSDVPCTCAKSECCDVTLVSCCERADKSLVDL